MTRRVGVAGLGLAAALAACTPAPRPNVAAGPVCAVGPEGGPPMAERGIGGTGAPTRIVERGIGGTGIIGVVTGFASLCLAGHEVALPDDVAIEIGGAASDQAALRAGQVAAVEAAGPANALYARRIRVRHEVEGPIEEVAADRLQVAGQTVLLSSETWLRTAPVLGQWVAVSGLRDATGAIAATRLDLVSTRSFVVHGVVRQVEDGYRIGSLPVAGALGDVVVPGLPVSVTGVYEQGMPRAVAVVPDPLAADPVAYFGVATTSFIFEGFAGTAEGRRYVGALPPLSQAAGGGRPIGPGRTVVEFERTGNGGVRVNSVAPSAGGVRPGTSERFQPGPSGAREGGGRSFEPAPMPNRALRFAPAPGRAGATRDFGDHGRSPGTRPQGGRETQGGGMVGGPVPGEMSGPGPGFDGGAGGRRR